MDAGYNLVNTGFYLDNGSELWRIKQNCQMHLWGIFMNVQKIFQALNEDDKNSALGIICGELENQGYSVVIDGVQVTSEGFFNGDHEEIENKVGPLNIILMTTSMTQKSKFDQEFCIDFTDFHECIIKQKQ